MIRCDLNSERSVLGAILLGASYAPEAGWRLLARVEAVGLAPESFYLATHAELFRQLCRSRDEGLPLDALSLSSAIERRAEEAVGPICDLIDFDLAGVRARLFELAHEVSATANAPHHAELVVREAKRRTAEAA